MDNADYNPKLLPVVLETGALADDPFVLLDVGCGMGPDPLWRLFGESLHVYGFDANIDEIERLTSVEESPNVHYRAALVGLPEDHAFFARRNADRSAPEHAYFNPWARTSSMRAIDRAWDLGNRSLSETNAWSQSRLATERVALDDFVEQEGIQSVDFVKVDTDGSDLEVLFSAERMLTDAKVLGLVVETSFAGSAAGTENTFHNIDRLLRQHGFVLYSLSVNRYSRAALPSPFAHNMYAQTELGQALWGDSLYLRDPASPVYATVYPKLTAEKLLKLGCLYELFRLPDCAAELLLTHRAELEGVLDVDRALDLLTPSLAGYPEGYADYVGAFEADPSRFLPTEPEPEPGQAPAEPRTIADDVKALAHRLALATWSRTPEPVRRIFRGALRSATTRR